MTRGCVYDESSGYVALTLRVLQEEGSGYEGEPIAPMASGDEWVCALAGTIVAAGVAAATLPAAPGAPVLAALAGESFTAGCMLANESNGTAITGLPRRSSNCFNTWTLSKRTHQYSHRVETCPA
jgi:hypothetical protein